MLQGFYSAASGMLMQQRHLNVISNNLANTQTPGFRSNQLVSQTFEETLQARLQGGVATEIGTAESTRIVSEVSDLWTHGGITETGRPFDMALQGYGFFNIQAEDGETYMTRNGMFDLDEEGFLILRGQGQVLSTGGAPIQVTISDILVEADGTIINSETGAEIAQLMITVPADDADMQQARNGMFTTANAAVAAENPMVLNGGYENSNVDMIYQQTAMISAQRNFSSAAQALQWIDQTYSHTVNIASL